MSHDTIIHRIVRPAVRLVAGTGITPNHVTTLRFATALAAAAAFAQGQESWTNIGAGVFVISALLDRADGELARQTRRSSPGGHRYDLIADCSAGVVAFIGLGIGAAAGPLGPLAVALGVLAGAGIAGIFWHINVRAPGKLPGLTARSGRILVDPDDGMFTVPLLLWCFGPEAALVPASIVTPLAALWLTLRRPAREAA